jgi:hypothetical protein
MENRKESKIELLSPEEILLKNFAQQVRSLQDSDPVGINIAADVVNVCITKLQEQRTELDRLQSTYSEHIRAFELSAQTNRQNLDTAIEYIESRLQAYPDLKKSNPNIQIQTSQIKRDNPQMFKAAVAYKECQNASGGKPTLEALISKLEGQIPESMVRKSYNLTKVSKYLDKHKHIFNQIN